MVVNDEIEKIVTPVSEIGSPTNVRLYSPETNVRFY